MTYLYFYNIFLVMLFTICITIFLVAIQFERSSRLKTIYKLFILLFIFYIFDNTIISLTELFSYFAHFYNSNFKGVPILKVVFYFFSNYILLSIIELLSHKKVNNQDIFIWLFCFFAMIISFTLKTSNLQVFLFYLPNQVFYLYCAFIALKNSKTIKRVSNSKLTILSYLGYTFFIFALTIVIEDFIVIFHYDNYVISNLHIQNRNFNSDLLSIFISLISILLLKEHNPSYLNFDTTETPSPIKSNSDFNNCFEQFSNDNHLTHRESEILQLMLHDFTNQQIAEQLFLSLGTVKTHSHNIYIKLNSSKRQDVKVAFEKYVREWQ